MNPIEQWSDNFKREQVRIYVVNVVAVFLVIFLATAFEFHTRGILNKNTIELISKTTLASALAYGFFTRAGVLIFNVMGSFFGFFIRKQDTLNRNVQSYLYDIFITLGFILITEPARPVLQEVYLNQIDPSYVVENVFFDAIPSVVILSIVGLPLIISLIIKKRDRVPWFQVFSVIFGIFFVGLYNNRPNYEARIYESRGHWVGRDWEAQEQSAEKALEDAKNNVERASAYYWMQVSENRRGNYEKSMEYGQRAIEESPNYGAPHSSLANSYLKLGNIEQAKIHVDECLRLSPDYAWCHYSASYYYYETGDIKTSYTEIKEAHALDPDSPDITKMYNWYVETFGDLK